MKVSLANITVVTYNERDYAELIKTSDDAAAKSEEAARRERAVLRDRGLALAASALALSFVSIQVDMPAAAWRLLVAWAILGSALGAGFLTIALDFLFFQKASVYSRGLGNLWRLESGQVAPAEPAFPGTEVVGRLRRVANAASISLVTMFILDAIGIGFLLWFAAANVL